jgi:hypothetical protein
MANIIYIYILYLFIRFSKKSALKYRHGFCLARCSFDLKYPAIKDALLTTDCLNINTKIGQ